MYSLRVSFAMKNVKLAIITANIVTVSVIYLLLGNLGEASALTLRDNHYDKWNCCDDLNKNADVDTGDIEQHGKQNAATNQICIAFNCEQKIVVDQNYAKDKATIGTESDNYDSNGKYAVNIYIDYHKTASHYHDGLLTAQVAGKTYVPYHFSMREAINKADGKQIFYIYNFNPGVLQDGDTYKICIKNLDSDEKDCREVNYHGSDGQNKVSLTFPS
jgi:hypothetical protein